MIRLAHIPSLRFGRLFAVAVIGAVGLSATCARAEPTSAAAEPFDPWQGMNRGLFAVGMGVDHVILAPVAHGYMRVAPSPLRDRVSSGVYNLGEPSTALEDILQGHPKLAGRATARFVINSTVGVLGLFDVANRWGIAPHASDFGQTLGRYGAHPGPYIYLPVIGPSDLRDGVGRIVDVVSDPVGLVTGPITTTAGAIRWGVTSLDTRVETDPAFSALKDATDPYATMRSGYVQHRQSVVGAARGETESLPDFN